MCVCWSASHANCYIYHLYTKEVQTSKPSESGQIRPRGIIHVIRVFSLCFYPQWRLISGEVTRNQVSWLRKTQNSSTQVRIRVLSTKNLSGSLRTMWKARFSFADPYFIPRRYNQTPGFFASHVIHPVASIEAIQTNVHFLLQPRIDN